MHKAEQENVNMKATPAGEGIIDMALGSWKSP